MLRFSVARGSLAIDQRLVLVAAQRSNEALLAMACYASPSLVLCAAGRVLCIMHNSYSRAKGFPLKGVPLVCDPGNFSFPVVYLCLCWGHLGGNTRRATGKYVNAPSPRWQRNIHGFDGTLALTSLDAALALLTAPCLLICLSLSKSPF